MTRERLDSSPLHPTRNRHCHWDNPVFLAKR